MPKYETYAEYIRRMAAQADQQDDVKRGPFPKRYGDQCPWCGTIHMSKAERAQCMLDNCG